MYKNLIWIIFLTLGLTTISSCGDDDVTEPEVEKTLLEIHQENLESITVDGNELSYLDYGESSDKVIILLHGAPTSSFLYRNIAPELAGETDFRVIALDLLGFGESDKPTRTGAYTVQSQAARVYAFADALGIDNFVLGLHDIGGSVGWTMFLSDQIDRISGLLITDTSLEPVGFTPPTFAAPIFTGQVSPEEHIEVIFDESVIKETTEEILKEGIFNEDLVTDELIDAYASSITQTEAYIEFFESSSSVIAAIPMIKEAFIQFDKPVAILWGKEDLFLDADIIPALFETDLNVPVEYVRILDNASHYLQEDAPEEYVNFVGSFLNAEF